MLVSSHLYYDNNPVAAPTSATRGIVRRGRRYQLRVRLPAPLARQTGRRELRLALGTTNLREALRRGLPLLTRLEQLFFDLRGGIVTEQTVHDIIRQFYDVLLNNLPGSEQLRLHSSLSNKEIEQAAADYRRLVGYDRAALKFGKFEHIAQTLDRFAEDHGFSIDKTSDN